MRLKTAAAALAASAVLAVPAVAATPAAAMPAGPPACSTYSNQVSYGASCGGTGGHTLV
ncbi:hypothetical protein [Streptomyces goshikiensis]|uniref:hypothetical protein n=1 Tax=Streptomyces goshikiensis TaxID=1942 RepID=UPI0036B71F3F